MEQKYSKKIVGIDQIQPSMVFAGFVEVPEKFHKLDDKHIQFLRKYAFKDIRVSRNKKEFMLDAEGLQVNDNVLELGRLKRYTLLKESERIKVYLSKFDFKNIKILVPDEKGDSIKNIQEVEEKEVRIAKLSKTERAQQIRDNLNDLQENIEKSNKFLEKGHNILANLFETGNFQNFKLDGVNEIAKEMSATLLKNPQSYNALTLLKDHDEYTYRHCVDVSNQMLMTLNFMYGDRIANLNEIAVGALLHDVGKSKIPLELINKPGKLTEKEWQYMKMHPIYSAQIMQKMGLSNLQVNIGLNHHVRKNAPGYPVNITFSKTSEIDRICSIADVFQALVTKRPYKTTDTPVQAFKKIKKWTESDFDEKLVDIFIKAFGIFPPGSMVKLNDGRSAFVIVRGVESVRPTVAVVIDENGSHMQNHEIVDLEADEYAELKIKGSVDYRNYYSDDECLNKFFSLT